MNIALYLASKIKNTKSQTFSSLIIKVGVLSITIAVSVLIISFSVLFGFKNTIKKKLFSLSSHIQISKITLNRSFEEASMPNNLELYNKIKKLSDIKSISEVGMKSIILKSDEEISGVVFKGVDKNYDWDEFKQNLVEGRLINFKDTTVANEIILSSKLCKELKLKLNDNVLIYIIQNPPRARKMKIVGIFNSDVDEMDKIYVMGDLKLLQKINAWHEGQFGHYEVFLKDIAQLNLVKKQLLQILPQEYQVQKVTEILPQFFDWFNLLDRNIMVVISLIIVVAAFNMISVLLIMIMERTPMIGLLKSMGSVDAQIRQIFIINGLKIVLKGLLFGNILGLLLCFLQYKFKFIHLDPTNYYMGYVPIEWNWLYVLFINIGVFVVVGLILFVPAYVIKNISPVKALKYKD